MAHKRRIGYTVFWLDGKGKVFRSHYFESSDYPTALLRTKRKMQHHREENQVCGFLLTEAPANALTRFFNPSMYAKPVDMKEIESHMYAPLHLRDDYLAKLSRKGAA